MQEVQAPFVLENLACTGAEERLIDCPVDRTDSDYNSNYDYGSYSGQPDRCEPFGPSYAFVACGSSTGPDGPCAPPLLPLWPPQKPPDHIQEGCARSSTGTNYRRFRCIPSYHTNVLHADAVMHCAATYPPHARSTAQTQLGNMLMRKQTGNNAPPGFCPASYLVCRFYGNPGLKPMQTVHTRRSCLSCNLLPWYLYVEHDTAWPWDHAGRQAPIQFTYPAVLYAAAVV